VNALESLLILPDSEKRERAILYTPAEIAQQPATWQQTFALFRQQKDAIRDFLSSAGIHGSGDKPTVLLIGAGSSDYAAKSLVSLLRRQWSCEVVACPSTDLITDYDRILRPDRRYLCISFSRSGDSPEGVAVLQRLLAFRPDIHQMVISCNRAGRMLGEAAGVAQALGICLDDAVNDRGLAMTSSFSNMVVFGQCLAHADDPEQYGSTLRTLVAAAESWLPVAANYAAELARDQYDKACFVGSGALRAVAQESALKLLELTAGTILTMSESTLGLRHGPMAALDDRTLFVCYLSGRSPARAYETDLLKEIGMKKLVRSRIAVGASSKLALDGWAENFLSPGMRDDLDDDYRTPVDVIFGQLLGLFFSLRCGLKPDNPSPNGAITRVVQSVNLY
jgi:tagatose-6-phosphate ketose/aldose isomerase